MNQGTKNQKVFFMDVYRSEVCRLASTNIRRRLTDASNIPTVIKPKPKHTKNLV